MKRVLLMALTDLKSELKYKAYIFWVFLLPMFFIFIFSSVSYKSPNSKASLAVLNQDNGYWSKELINALSSEEKLNLKFLDSEKDLKSAVRYLIIPKNFTKYFNESRTQDLIIYLSDKADTTATSLIKSLFMRVQIELLSKKVLSEDKKNSAKEKKLFTVTESFYETPKIPSGKYHVIPGIMVQFILLNIMIFGGMSLYYDRVKGGLERKYSMGVSKAEIWNSKFVYLIFSAGVQALIIIVSSVILFGFRSSSPFLLFLILLALSLTAASLSLFIGSVILKDNLIIAVCVMLGNIMAALGGCWWPNELLNGFMLKIAMISPAYWAMSAFHEVLFFNGKLLDISVELIVLFSISIIFALISYKKLKVMRY